MEKLSHEKAIEKLNEYGFHKKDKTLNALFTALYMSKYKVNNDSIDFILNNFNSVKGRDLLIQLIIELANKGKKGAFIHTTAILVILILFQLQEKDHKIFKLSEPLTQSLYHTDIQKIDTYQLHVPLDNFIIYPANHYEILPNVGMSKIDYFIYYTTGYKNNEALSCFIPVSDISFTKEGQLQYKGGFITTKHSKKFVINPKLCSMDDFGINLFLSSLAYINMPRSEKTLIKSELSKNDFPSNPKKLRRFIKKSNKTKYNVLLLGNTYKSYIGQRADPSNPIDKRVVVRGHFRPQWYGCRTDENGEHQAGERCESIWIEPFLRRANLPKGYTDCYKVVKD